MLFSNWFTLLFTIVCKPIHDNPKEASHRLIHDMSIGNYVLQAILGIGIVAISIGAISKKVISYPAGGCMKGAQEMTFNQKTINYFI